MNNISFDEVSVIGSFANPYNYKFNGKELDEETGLYYYGARYYEPRVNIWLSVDPLAEKYPSMSPYIYCANNPIIYIDFDGRDIVYFDINGNELVNKRVSSNTIFKTYVSKNKANTSFNMAPMPNVIPMKGKADTSGPLYQRFDYVIAADTYIFNRNKNNGTAKIIDSNGNVVPSSNFNQIPDLDPTAVKAAIMQETTMGTDQGGERNGTQDIMQCNVYFNAAENDWGDGYKSVLGLTKDGSAHPRLSIYAGIRLMAGNGFSSTPNWANDGKGTISSRNFTFRGWENAIIKYNGGGALKYGQTYDVMKLYNSSTTPKASNYVK